MNWVDYLVIAATALTFVTVLAANSSHAARAETSSIIPASQLPPQGRQLGTDLGMARAAIGFALAGR